MSKTRKRTIRTPEERAERENALFQTRGDRLLSLALRLGTSSRRMNASARKLAFESLGTLLSLWTSEQGGASLDPVKAERFVAMANKSAIGSGYEFVAENGQIFAVKVRRERMAIGVNPPEGNGETA